MTPGSGHPWRVIYLQEARDRFRTWFREAADGGFSLLFEASMRLATHHLAADPEDLGDPLLRYTHLGLLLHRGPTPLFLVLFAFDSARRLVYVRSALPSPGSPLTSS